MHRMRVTTAVMTFNSRSAWTLLAEEIAEEGENLTLNIIVTITTTTATKGSAPRFDADGDGDGDAEEGLTTDSTNIIFGLAAVNLYTMIENNCNIIRHVRIILIFYEF